MSLRVMTMDVGGHRKGNLVDLEEDSPFFRWSQPAGGDAIVSAEPAPAEVPDEEEAEWVAILAEEEAENEIQALAQEVNDGPSDDEPSLDSEDAGDFDEGSSGSS
jgi:hypothetical protein